MPHLVRWHRELGSELFNIVTIFSYDEKSVSKIEKLLNKEKVGFPVLVEKDRIMKQLHVKAYPAASFLDKNGTIVWQGLLPRSGGKSQWLQDLLRKSGVEPKPPVIRWLGHEEALEKSRITGRPVLLFIHARGCYQSTRIENEILQDGFLARTLDGFIPARIDGRADMKIVKSYGASWPGDLLIIQPTTTVLHRYQKTWDLEEMKKALEENAVSPPENAEEERR
ncbi:MAG TPA: hypothetical protein EYN79_03380 [Planctomycetes bacterium]|nr:hypothetical protein [Planctomycetota bacterium]HIN79835.1 hypothetical protein [Planctomycetota bacterium]